MSLKAVLESLDLLDAATVTGPDVAAAVRAAGVTDVEVKRFTGPAGSTDFVRCVVPAPLLAIHREEGAWLRKAWDDAEGAWAPAVLTLTRHPGAEAAASTGPTLDAKTGLTSPTPP